MNPTLLTVLIIAVSLLAVVFIVGLFMLRPKKDPAPQKEKVKKVKLEVINSDGTVQKSPKPLQNTLIQEILIKLLVSVLSVILIIVTLRNSLDVNHLVALSLGIILTIFSVGERRTMTTKILSAVGLSIGLLLIRISILPLIPFKNLMIAFLIPIILILLLGVMRVFKVFSLTVTSVISFILGSLIIIATLIPLIIIGGTILIIFSPLLIFVGFIFLIYGLFQLIKRLLLIKK